MGITLLWRMSSPYGCVGASAASVGGDVGLATLIKQAESTLGRAEKQLDIQVRECVLGTCDLW